MAEELRNCPVQIFMKKSEKEKVDKAAERLGLTLSGFSRYAMLRICEELEGAED